MTASDTRWLRRSMAIGLLFGLGAGAVVAASMTWRDWQINPSGLFHGPSGAQWAIVLETAWSWFWPVASSACLAGFLVATLWQKVPHKA